MQDKGNKYKYLQFFFSETTMGETGKHYKRPNKEDKRLKMQNISISLRQPSAEIAINCALSDCISSLLPEIYLNA